MHILPNLSASITSETYASLTKTLPPPAPDTSEARASRDDAAMQAVAVLRPADALEARLAVDVVAADAHAKECLRLASLASNEITVALRCRAQFALMMRQVQSALRTLQNLQAARQRVDPVPARGEDQRACPTPPRPESPTTRDPAAPDPPPEPDWLSEAHNYAVLYPLFAARIRAAGGLPARLDFTPPDPAVVDVLVNGTSLLLNALVEMGHDMTQVA